MDPEDPFAPTPKKVKSSNNILNIRMRPAGLEWIDGLAKKHSVTRSEIVKAALALAAARQKEFTGLLEARK